MVGIPNDGKGSPWTRSGGTPGLYTLGGLSEWEGICRQLKETIPGKFNLCELLLYTCFNCLIKIQNTIWMFVFRHISDRYWLKWIHIRNYQFILKRISCNIHENISSKYRLMCKFSLGECGSKKSIRHTIITSIWNLE